MRNILTTLGLTLAVTTCEQSPVFADADPAPTTDAVLAVMRRLPEERCLYAPKAKGCELPAHYERGPDAARIAAAIAGAADGSLTGTRLGDAALMATYTSYESGNVASAIGDGGRAHGCVQLWWVSPEIAFDPMRALPVWRALAKSTMEAPVCRDNPPDEKLAGVAGSCSYAPAKRKVRLRAAAARDALAGAE